MKNRTKNFVKFESEKRLESHLVTYPITDNCTQGVTTAAYLNASIQRIKSSRINTLSTSGEKIHAGMEFNLYPSFECRLRPSTYAPDIPLYGEILNYKGIKSIRVEVDGFWLISSNYSTQMYLEPGRTYEYPLWGNHFFIAFKRQGVIPFPTVYLELNHEIGSTTPPIDECLGSAFLVEICDNIQYEGNIYAVDGVTNYIGAYGQAKDAPLDLSLGYCIDVTEPIRDLSSSIQTIRTSRLSQPDHYYPTGHIFSKLEFGMYNYFECQLKDPLYSTAGPIYLNGVRLNYKGIRSIRVEEGGFSLISSRGTKLELQPGHTYEYPFEEYPFEPSDSYPPFFIAYLERGRGPAPTVYLDLMHVDHFTYAATSFYEDAKSFEQNYKILED